MTINSEQIQALKAAAEKATPGEWVVEFDDEVYSTDGVNSQQIAMVFSEHGYIDATLIAAANPAVILSLLAEREADKALISESVVLFETLSQRIAELEQRHCGGALMEREQHHVGVVNKLLERITELEARTLTVKLPEPFYPDGDIDCPLVVELDDVKSACAAAGITLVVGE